MPNNLQILQNFQSLHPSTTLPLQIVFRQLFTNYSIWEQLQRHDSKFGIYYTVFL